MVSTYDTATDETVVTGSATSMRRRWHYELHLFQEDGQVLIIEGTMKSKVDIHTACRSAIELVNEEIASGLPEPVRIKVKVMSKKKCVR